MTEYFQSYHLFKLPRQQEWKTLKVHEKGQLYHHCLYTGVTSQAPAHCDYVRPTSLALEQYRGFMIKRGKTGSNTNFSHLQQRLWPLTEVGCQSPQNRFLQPQKLPRYQKQLLSSTLRDLLRKDLLKALSVLNMSQRRQSGSLQEVNGLALLIYLLLFGRT